MRDVCGVQGEQGWGGASLARRYAWVEFQMDLSPSLMLVLLWNGELLLSRCEQHDSTLESSITVLDILHYYACRVLVTDCCNCILWITNICSVSRCPRQHVPGVRSPGASPPRSWAGRHWWGSIRCRAPPAARGRCLRSAARPSSPPSPPSLWTPTIELGYFLVKSVSKCSNIQTVVNFLVIPNYLNSRTEL